MSILTRIVTLSTNGAACCTILSCAGFCAPYNVGGNCRPLGRGGTAKATARRPNDGHAIVDPSVVVPELLATHTVAEGKLHLLHIGREVNLQSSLRAAVGHSRTGRWPEQTHWRAVSISVHSRHLQDGTTRLNSFHPSTASICLQRSIGPCLGRGWVSNNGGG